jgi:hypothetical protein
MAIVLLGSTSGSVTLQEPAVAGTTVLSLPASSGTFITTGSSGQSIPRAALPTGSVLQVVQSIKTDRQTTSSTTWVDVTGLSVTITPTSASNRILVMASVNTIGTGDGNGLYVNLVRNSTTIVSTTAGGNSQEQGGAWGVSGGGGMTSGNDNRKYANPSLTYLDSPATTSATTYKVQARVSGGTGSINSWPLNNDQSSVCSLTVMEIAA